MKSDHVEILQNLSLFRGLSVETLQAVARRTVSRSLPRDTVLFRKGEPCHGLYVVIAGRIRVYRANRDGREQVLHVQGPGQTLAEVPLFDAAPYPASARAEEDSRVLFLPINDFQHLYRTHPEITDSIIRELGRRLRRMVSLVEKISLKDVPARVAITLLEHGERAGPLSNGLEFDLPRTQEELAAELATTRESVARALSRLRREGIISQQGARVRILSVAGLEAIAHSGRQ